MGWFVLRRFSWLDMVFVFLGVAVLQNAGWLAWSAYMLAAVFPSVVAENVWGKDKRNA